MKISKRFFLKGLLSLPMATKAFGITKDSTKDLAKEREAKEEGRRDKLRLCFGSCNHQSGPQSFWPIIAEQNPDSWFWLGDNIYGDSEDPSVLKGKYRRILEGPYRKFFSRFKVEGIWDDHDYGQNGGDWEYPSKIESQKLLLDFLGVDEEDERRHREGVYYSRIFSVGRKSVKVYFLDCRYFKDASSGEDDALLGQAQWQWLENEIATSTAEVNLFVSPIGVLLNRLFVTEDWYEYSAERRRLLDLIGKHDLSGTFFLSGDKHFGAAIKRSSKRIGKKKVDYYEFQSSGLTHGLRKELNIPVKTTYGRKNVVTTRNFGQIDFLEVKGHLHMIWTLHSLTDKNLKVIRNFQLDERLWRML